jgi:hypothetical protein
MKQPKNALLPECNGRLFQLLPHRGGALFKGQRFLNIRPTPASGVGAMETPFPAGYQTLHHPGKRGGVRIAAAESRTVI